MKTRKVMAVLGSTMLMGAIALTGCSIGKDGIKLEANGTEANVKAELDDELTGEDYGEVPEDEEQYYCCMGLAEDFVSTNGELEGQLDYMALVTPCDQMDWSNYPDDDTLKDADSIEDEDIRNLAQEYLNDGYTIIDPDVMREYCTPILGDGEYMFTEGFYGYHIGDTTTNTVYVFKMNETLFNYFLVDTICGTDIQVNDDGTVITYDVEGQHVEFNRETGVGINFFYTEGRG